MLFDVIYGKRKKKKENQKKIIGIMDQQNIAVL